LNGTRGCTYPPFSLEKRKGKKERTAFYLESFFEHGNRFLKWSGLLFCCFRILPYIPIYYYIPWAYRWTTGVTGRGGFAWVLLEFTDELRLSFVSLRSWDNVHGIPCIFVSLVRYPPRLRSDGCVIYPVCIAALNNGVYNTISTLIADPWLNARGRISNSLYT
jgi:hypothetical protein